MAAVTKLVGLVADARQRQATGVELHGSLHLGVRQRSLPPLHNVSGVCFRCMTLVTR
jgi:hypothetical protein